MIVVPGPAVRSQVAPEQEVVALIVEGTGFGHGRGMSQWGAYGRAVNGGQSWTQILNAYYGGTTLGSVSTSTRIRVRLLAHDGDSTVGVISTTRQGAMGVERHGLCRDPGASHGDRQPLRHLGANDGSMPGVVHVRMESCCRQRRRPDHVLDDGERVERSRR